MVDCIFCKIANKEIPKDFEHEDKNLVVFADIHPVAPVHLLFVPKKHIEDFTSPVEDKTYLAIIAAIKKMIEKNNLMGKGYKIIVNGGGAQIINHLHFHLIGPTGLKAKL